MNPHSPEDPQAERDARIQRFREGIPGWTDRCLQDRGLAPLELRARWEEVTTGVRKVFPADALSALEEHVLPIRGFGLGGGVGIGKTCALAAWVRRKTETEARVKAERIIRDAWSGPYLDQMPLARWACWVNWPGEVSRLRGMLYTAPREVEGRICELQEIPLLVVDDLGAERMVKGGYGEDWGGDALARILDERHRHDRVTLWTTNLGPEDIAQRYGARFYSRLLEDHAPLAELPRLPDRRRHR